MPRTKLQQQTWTALLSWGITGLVIPYVRRAGHARSTDAASWPKDVRDYFLLDDPKWPHRSSLDRETFDGLKIKDRMGNVRAYPNHLSKVVTEKIDVHVPDPPKAIRGKHVIRSLADLCAYFCADTDNPRSLNRRVYKDTDCGASISVLTPDGQWHHNGEDWTGVTAIEAFTLQTIVEGSDAEVNSEPFWLPVRERDVASWMKHMEEEADRLWHEANDDPEASEE